MRGFDVFAHKSYIKYCSCYTSSVLFNHFSHSAFFVGVSVNIILEHLKIKGGNAVVSFTSCIIIFISLFTISCLNMLSFHVLYCFLVVPLPIIFTSSLHFAIIKHIMKCVLIGIYHVKYKANMELL